MYSGKYTGDEISIYIESNLKIADTDF